MSEINSYWPIYKNLEDEALQLAKYIHFTDNQTSVYSMHIADLITRTVIEIEALSKELYKMAEGPEVFDEDGNQRYLLYDSDCIKYLNSKWGICEREIIVSCQNFYFIDEKYKKIKPLKKAYQNGDKSEIWNRAYQALKHDRRESLNKGTIWNFIQALGALYILNIYYKDDVNKSEYTLDNLDNRFGSNLFAISIVDASKVSIGLDDTDNAISDDEKKKMSSAIYIIKYTDEEWENLHKEFDAYNKKILQESINMPNLIKKINEKLGPEILSNSEIVPQTVKDTIQEIQKEYVERNPPVQLGIAMSKGKKELVLNKNQIIYRKK